MAVSTQDLTFSYFRFNSLKYIPPSYKGGYAFLFIRGVSVVQLKAPAVFFSAGFASDLRFILIYPIVYIALLLRDVFSATRYTGIKIVIASRPVVKIIQGFNPLACFTAFHFENLSANPPE